MNKLTIEEYSNKLTDVGKLFGFVASPNGHCFTFSSPMLKWTDDEKFGMKIPFISSIRDDEDHILSYTISIPPAGQLKLEQIDLYTKVLYDANQCVKQLNKIMDEYFNDGGRVEC